jgi:hypothetical protein
MPDKSQNININYKFNTQDIDKLNASVSRANAATNGLQQGAQQAGQKISTEFRKAIPSIEGMRINLARLKTQLDLSTNPASTAKLSAEFKKLKTELDAATKSAYNLASAQKQTAASTQSMASQFGNLYQATKLILTAGIAKEIVSISLEMARLAGNVDGVSRAFKNQIPNSVSLLDRLRKATQGTVGDLDLMQRALKAQNFGIDVQRLPELLEFAAIRAQQTGESVDYLVNSIVDGLGRKSLLKLDNLGISASRLKEEFNGASLASLSVAQVTEGVANIVREETEKMGGYVKTSATAVDQLAVSWEKLRISLAQRLELGTSGLTEFLNSSLQGLRSLVVGSKELFLEEARRLGAADALRVVESKEYKAFADNQQGKFDLIQQEINSRVQLLGRYNDNISALKEERKQIDDNNPYDKRIDVLTKQIRAYNDNKVVIASTILALKEYLKALDLTNQKEQESIVTIQTLRDQLKALQEQREEQTFIGNTKELDRLQREILLLDDRILKIADNIKWQKQWDRSREESALAALNQAEAEKKLGDEIDKLTQKFAGGTIAFSTGDLLGKTDAKETFDTDALEEAIKELAVFGEEAVAGLNEMAPEWIIRIRLGFQGKGGDTSELQKMINEELLNLRNTAFESGLDLLHAEVDAEANALKERLKQTEDFYAEQQLLAGDNEKAKQRLRLEEERETAKIRNEIARKEKQARRTHILIDIAAGIAKALATYPWPYALIPAAAVAVQGAAQLAIVNRAPTSFAEGVIDLKGPGTSKSDSIPANLSKGESVMTAWETRHAGQVLREVRAKKLDDRILRDLRTGGREPIQVLNDERIIKAIKDQKPPDVVKIGSTLYDVRKQTETYKKRIRNSSLSI